MEDGRIELVYQVDDLAAAHAAVRDHGGLAGEPHQQTYGRIADCIDVMQATPRHTYQVLTKRSPRLRRLAPRLPWPKNVWMGVSVEDDDHVRRG